MTTVTGGGRPTLQQAMNARYRSKGWLVSQLETNKTARAIAAEAGCTVKTLRHWLRRYGLWKAPVSVPLGPCYPASHRRWLDYQWLRMMEEADYTLRQMAEMAGCSRGTIHTHLRRAKE